MNNSHEPLKQAMKLHQSQRHGEAESICREVLSREPSNLDALKMMSAVVGEQNRLDEAINNYSRAVQLRPTDTGFVLLGHALESAGRRSEALAAYENALKLSPDLPEAQHAVDALSETR